MIKLQQEVDEDGVVTGYYAKGLHSPEAFMEAVKAEVGEGDPILDNEPYETWVRYCRDFKRKCSTIVAAYENSRGAFRAMWIDVQKGD